MINELILAGKKVDFVFTVIGEVTDEVKAYCQAIADGIPAKNPYGCCGKKSNGSITWKWKAKE